MLWDRCTFSRWSHQQQQDRQEGVAGRVHFQLVIGNRRGKIYTSARTTTRLVGKCCGTGASSEHGHISSIRTCR